MSSATDLVALLADPQHAGAFYVSDADREAMLAAAQSLGFAIARADLAGCVDKAGALAAVAAALAFPDWFGHNWDALADALGDLSWAPAPGRLLLIEHVEAWRAAEPDRFDTLVQILDDAAADWATRDVAFWSLLPLPDAQMAAYAG